ncbi:MAG: sulfurtransferase TusA family protein [Gammaproteobacteria bacterium]
MSTTLIDARNLLCPLPAIRTQDGVGDLQPGDMVEVLCTDPGVVHDIPAWCRIWGHEVRENDDQKNQIMITICIGARD